MSAQPDELERKVHGAAAHRGPEPEILAQVERLAREGKKAYEIAELLMISPQRFYDQLRAYPQLAETYGRALGEYQTEVEAVLNRAIRDYDADPHLAVSTAKFILPHRFKGWQDRQVIEQHGDVTVHGTVEHEVDVKAWSTPERIAALAQMADELGLVPAAVETPKEQPPPTPQPERPSTELVVQQRLDPARRYDGDDGEDDHEHYGLAHNRKFCFRCNRYRSEPWPLWGEQ